MRRVLIGFLVAAFVVASIPVNLRAAEPVVAGVVQETGIITGVATTQDGAALANFQVKILNAQGEEIGTATTNAAGQYTVNVPPGTNYTVQIINPAAQGTSAVVGTSTVTSVTAGVPVTANVASSLTAAALAGGAAVGGGSFIASGLGILTLAGAGAAAVVTYEATKSPS